MRPPVLLPPSRSRAAAMPAGSATREGAAPTLPWCTPAAAPGRYTRSAWRAGSCSKQAAGEHTQRPPAAPHRDVMVLTPPLCPHMESEETHCRFCNARYPDWRPALTPAGLPPLTAAAAGSGEQAAAPAVAPVMAIYYNGEWSGAGWIGELHTRIVLTPVMCRAPLPQAVCTSCACSPARRHTSTSSRRCGSCWGCGQERNSRSPSSAGRPPQVSGQHA